MLLTLLACGADLSNAVFLEDADFLAALPSRDTLTLDYPESPGCAELASEEAWLYILSVCSLENTDLLLALVAATSETVRAVAPTERDDAYRRWGPGDWDLAPGVQLKAEMWRSTSGAHYTWLFAVSETVDGPWDTMFEGYHYGGSESVAAGFGAFNWDFGAQYRYQDAPGTGTLRATYDLREGVELLVEADEVAVGIAAEPASADWWYAATEDGGGDFEYQSDDVFGEDIDAEIRTRWTAAGDGRGDAAVQAGHQGLFDTTTLSQCWTADGVVTYQHDAGASVKELGTEEDCPFEDTAEVEHLP